MHCRYHRRVLSYWYTIHPENYAHGRDFALYLYGYVWVHFIQILQHHFTISEAAVRLSQANKVNRNVWALKTRVFIMPTLSSLVPPVTTKLASWRLNVFSQLITQYVSTWCWWYNQKKTNKQMKQQQKKQKHNHTMCIFREMYFLLIKIFARVKGLYVGSYGAVCVTHAFMLGLYFSCLL